MKITTIEQGTFEAVRPRSAGSNARLGDHGPTIRLPIVRLTLDDGSSGFGHSRASQEYLAGLVGSELDPDLDPTVLIDQRLRSIEFPLLDLLAKRRDLPVYRMVSDTSGPLRLSCYDTSLYFDDLHLASNDDAVALLVQEAQDGLDRGHRNFKIKVGRGARHLPLEQGTQRDIAIIRAIRELTGPGARIMIDANNGYNLNLTRRVLTETADCDLYWLEEAFHEDPVLYADLKEWMAKESLDILVADGEGWAAPNLVDWAKDGLVDVIQYDIISPGFTHWLELGPRLDAMGVKSAPHHYGTMYGNFATCHLAPAIEGFQMAEWDPAETPGIDTSGYTIADGYVTVPDAPGFGLDLDDAHFREVVAANGFSLN
ncbi:MAG: enolase C-terminal domain-like protein [Thermomicrobiales bacterium]